MNGSAHSFERRSYSHTSPHSLGLYPGFSSLELRRCSGFRLALGRRAIFVALLALTLLWFLAATITLAPRRYPPVVPGVKRLQLSPSLPEPPAQGTVEVVVSRFKDDLSWLPALAQLLNANVTVYCKESPAPPPLVACTETLPNVGNEGHSYLHHMVVRYSSLAPITVFLPDTVWNDPTLQKPHYTHDVVTAVRASTATGHFRFADFHWPDNWLRFVHSRVKELVQGFKFPCADRNRGSKQCRWDGTSGANPQAGVLAPAEPNDFVEWMRLHTGTTVWDMLRCGWSFRGVFAASEAAIRGHEVGLYAHLRDELSKAMFPMAGMYQERLWRRLFLCSGAASE